MSDRLVVTLTLHPKFGYLLQPVFTSFDAGTGVYRITETAHDRGPDYENLSEGEKKIVNAAVRFSDRALMKVYSHEKNEAAFLQKVTPETIQTYIRPFIEKRHEEILSILSGAGH